MEWIIEYENHWSDGCKDYEQTINIEADSKEEATKLGKIELCKMDERDNRICYCVNRVFYRCVESDKFSYNSSAKEDNGIYKDAGYVDSILFGKVGTGLK